MKILINTSYFLSLIKISFENIPQDLLIDLLTNTSNEYFYSNLTLFELAAKGIKLLSQNNIITPQDIRIGIDAILNDSRLIGINFTDNPLIIELASQMHTIHKDTIDNLIFATAICTCDCIITMDDSFFKEINNSPTLIRAIKDIKENFQFRFKDLSRNLKSLT